MATKKDYLDYILQQLSGLEGITYRPMMGEYTLYYQGRIAAYLCDDRLLVKPVPEAIRQMPGAPMVPPYPGAGKMLLVEQVDDSAFLTALFEGILPQLPPKKRRKTK